MAPWVLPEGHFRSLRLCRALSLWLAVVWAAAARIWVARSSDARSSDARACVLLAAGVGLLLGAGHTAWAQLEGLPPLPTYRLRAHLDTAAHTLSGELRVELPPGAVPADGTLWFHLPPNRFAEPDPRGPRRSVGAPSFEAIFYIPRYFDPLEPAAFSRGAVEVLAVTDETGAALPHALADNPQLPIGYATQGGLLRVTRPPPDGSATANSSATAEGPVRAVVIRFRTLLPERHWNGWSGGNLLLSDVLPRLTAWGNPSREGTSGEDARWDNDPYRPFPGYYAAEVSVDREGWMLAGWGRSAKIGPEQPFLLELQDAPTRTLPLVFLRDMKSSIAHSYRASVESHFRPEHRRQGEFALRVAHNFLGYMQEHFGLPPPQGRIVLIETDLPPGDIRIAGGLVFIPQVYFRNDPLLDRLLVGRLSRALAQLWFGETVYSERDHETWLHLGLAGYLSLDYYETLFGWDAGIHNVMDWLQPRYREHFFETPVRSYMRLAAEAPPLVSLHSYPSATAARIAHHYKSPLVLRAMSYVMGKEAFSTGLNMLYHRYRYREVTTEQWVQVFSEAAGKDMAPFMEPWLHGTPQLDFAITGWRQEAADDGTVRVFVQVQRTPGPFPADVRVVSESGEEHTVRWEVGEPTAELVFQLAEPPSFAVIDPQEYWLEVDRRNNYTETLYRVRPIYDWPKQREVLVTVDMRLGGTAVDGNYFGLGARIGLAENNNLYIVPIYGELTGLGNYEVAWIWSSFLKPHMALHVAAVHIAGVEQQSFGLGYAWIGPHNSENHVFRSLTALNREQVPGVTYTGLDGLVVSTPAGAANNLELTLEWRQMPGRYHSGNVRAELKRSTPGMGSAFEFTSYWLGADQTFALAPAHLLTFGLRRGGIDGTAPVPHRFLLGDPSALRGYPRVLQLAYEQIAVGRFDYGWAMHRGVLGGAVQSRRIIGFLFTEAGRGWNNGQSSDVLPLRRSAGVGIESVINLTSLVEFPLRLDVAYPLNDPLFDGPQIILFGLLSF